VSEIASSRTRSLQASVVAGVGLGIFVVAVLSEHVFVSKLSPATHQISEYANDPRTGWLMTVGFFAWSLSLAASARCAVGFDRKGLMWPTAWLLFLAAAAMFMTACFHTQTVAGVLPVGRRLTTSGRLHDLGSGITTLALLGAAIASAWMFRNPRAFRRFVWGVLILASTSDVVLLLIGRSVGGIRERLLVATGCAWQAAFIGVATRRSWISAVG
jgi:hypothetical protein